MKHFFSHCAISPLTPAGLQASKFYLEDQATHGMTNFMGYYLESQEAFKNTFAQLLKTSAGNIAAVKNTSEAMSMIANRKLGNANIDGKSLQKTWLTTKIRLHMTCLCNCGFHPGWKDVETHSDEYLNVTLLLCLGD